MNRKQFIATILTLPLLSFKKKEPSIELSLKDYNFANGDTLKAAKIAASQPQPFSMFGYNSIKL